MELEKKKTHIAEKLRNSYLIKRLRRYCEITIEEHGQDAIIHIADLDFTALVTEDGKVDAEVYFKHVIWAKLIGEERKISKRFLELCKKGGDNYFR